MKNASKILEIWERLPESVKQRKASEAELEEFEKSHEPIPGEYRWFLMNCGGGPIGPDFIDGIEELPNSHAKFRNESLDKNGWKSEGFLIGWDGAGNPIIINRGGKIIVEDHNFGEIYELSSSFEALLDERLGSAT